MSFLLLLIIGISQAFAGETPGSKSASPSYVSALFQKIQDSGRYAGRLDAKALTSLPVGIPKEINGQTYIIGIDSARFTTKGGFFSVYIELPVPGTDKTMAFGAKNVAFNPGGISLSTSTKLILLSADTIALNDHVDLLLPADGSNYVEWDCNGFKDVNLHGQFRFDSGMIKPLDHNGYVSADFSVNAKDIHNILATVNIAPFALTSVPDFTFKVTNAVVDMSDIANPASMPLSGLDVKGEDAMLWRGFFLQDLEISLPTQFTQTNGKRPVISAKNMLIDDNGVSGDFAVENLVQLGNASAGGWPISIDKIGVSFKRSQVSAGTLAGLMQLSFLSEDTLRYSATMGMQDNDLSYAFSITTTATRNYNWFGGTLTLDKNSTVTLQKVKDDFVGGAVLNGKMSINKGLLNVPDVAFQTLTLSTQKPYLRSGVFKLDGKLGFSMAGFGISLDSLQLGLMNGQVAIGAKVKLNLMDGADKSFTASSSFVVTANQVEKTQTVQVGKETIQKTSTSWKFDKVKINDVALTCDVLAFHLKGSLTLFQQHPVYGNGFKGNLEFNIPGLIPEARANMYFGTKDAYRYWHGDLYVSTHLSVGMLEITGLMGGVSYHMERPPAFDPFKAQATVKDSMINNTEVFAYVPSADAGLGLMAGASLALSGANTLVNANAMLEVQFGTNGSFRYAQFDGAAYVLSKPEKPQNIQDTVVKTSAPICGKLYMRFDKTNNTFNANLKIYVNVYGIIRGTNANNLMGEAVMYFSPDDWWVYIGKPSQMMGLTIADIATVQSYFMIGSKVENMPPPPPEVTGVLTGINADFMQAENAMSKGQGMGFGAHFKVGFNFDKDGIPIYASFGIGAGTDILLRNYGEARCKGSENPIGVNGWYASGQAYAYLQGKVGIKVKIFGKKKRFDIVNLAAAALLQAKLPNPSWMQGAVGVKYSILGGLIKGSASVKVTIGTECEIVGAREIELQVISDIKPDSNSTNVSVFATPQVAFALPVNKAFSMMNNDDEMATYRVQVDEFKLSDAKTGVISSTMTLSDDATSASLNLRDILPPNSSLTASVKVHFDKQNGAAWAPLVEEGVVNYEVKAATFQTGEAPDNIPWENVAYCYPLKRQYNFYPGEYPKAYIKLKRGQPYLFAGKDDKGSWKVQAHFQTPQGATADAPVSYDAANTQVNLDLPNGLKAASIYHFSLLRLQTDGVQAKDNITQATHTDSGNDDTTTITQTKLKGVAMSGGSKVMLENDFRTSRYSSFTQKMNAFANAYDVFDVAEGYISVIGKRFDAPETFDRYELNSDATFNTLPLVSAAALPQNNWLQQQLMPLLYNGYPFVADLTITHRDTAISGGIPPMRAVQTYNNDDQGYDLTDDDISEGQAASKPGRCRVMYYVSYVGNMDYHELLNKATDNVLAGKAAFINNPSVQRLLVSKYVDLQSKQDYPVQLTYRLPGTRQVTSSVQYKIHFY
ncbi:hypothetical protein [Deminuibacter soli]|uniref:Uncharacterized protein n=1 Tax=Deminuibacter soli TaxID=2291815 RepID=A0A3E1ND19_9BACT|nr:hypothetical protein [Deminuibacter soli]RFM25853.1 hypothetical protein DXN05_23115 [Deminuibacter soli]